MTVKLLQNKDPENYFRVHQEQRGIFEGDKLLSSFLKKSLNSSCQNVYSKKTALTFFEHFVIVIG